MTKKRLEYNPGFFMSNQTEMPKVARPGHLLPGRFQTISGHFLGEV